MIHVFFSFILLFILIVLSYLLVRLLFSLCLHSLSSFSVSLSPCDVVCDAVLCVVVCVCVVCVVQMINGNGVSVQARSYMQLIGWQNTWEQAPGVHATPTPP